jgi:multidrug efflux pump
MNIVDVALYRHRTVLLLLVLVLLSGIVSYFSIPKESYPDLTAPYIFVSLSHEGISPEDADRLLINPVYRLIQGLDGIKEVTSAARQGGATLTLEFQMGTDIDQALINVREKVDMAKSELPNDSDEPIVAEINLALFPILVIAIAGNIDEAVLLSITKDLKDDIEAIPSVLEAKIKGGREEQVEVVIDPLVMDSYGLTQDSLFQLVSRNNQLIAAGMMDTGEGRYAIKLPGLIEDQEDILNLPVKVDNDKVIRFRDLAFGRRTFKDATSLARMNGTSTITLEISKRLGANIIDTVEQTRATIDKAKDEWPEGIEITYAQDQSIEIEDTLNDLVNNVAFATLLVMIVIVASLGLRSSILVGVAIPGSFLSAILMLSMMGYTLNMVVLFALILAVGMLVDGAIVVTEYADRKMTEGKSRFTAYSEAARRMGMPITASTMTTLVVFMPLLFWPDMTGEFMKYLPITLIITLSASLVMALIAVPTLGSLFGSPGTYSENTHHTLATAEKGDLSKIGGWTGTYLKWLAIGLNNPKRLMLLVFLVLFAVYGLYFSLGKGVEFFPETEVNGATVTIRARGDLSLAERDTLVREVESQLLPMPEIKAIYTLVSTRASSGGGENPEDQIGMIQLELSDWFQRRPIDVIIEEMRQKTEHLGGIVIEAQKRKDGPSQGQDIQIAVASDDLEQLYVSTSQIVELLEESDGLFDLRDTRPLAGIEWHLLVDRAEASRFGADVASIGSTLQMLTNGLHLGEYLPDNAEDEIDIRMRYPYDSRNLDQLERLRIPTNQGLVPLTRFVTREAQPKVTQITRAHGYYAFKIYANVKPGLVIQDKVNELTPKIQTIIPKNVRAIFKGDQQKQQESELFLLKAFGVALFLMAVILVTQFNSFYQSFLILSAVLLSTTGVFLGLLIRGEPFGIVMSGVGIIALAGIVVNNNIVLIDTYNYLITNGAKPMEAALRTGAQRLRPVMLTTVTTILGLLPMMLELNIDLFGKVVSFGAPSAQWWTQLATAIAGGLAFATVLTLFVTPCLLLIGPKRAPSFERFELGTDS